MFDLRTRAAMAAIVFAALGIGCDGSSPTRPSPQPQLGNQPAGAPATVAGPSITGVSPTSGITGGGTLVQIVGTGFGPNPRVTFGGLAATNIGWSPNGTTINATTPSNAARAVDVAVFTSGGQSAQLAGGFTYGAAAPLTITTISEAVGSIAGGTYLYVKGSGVQAGTKVTFDGVEARIIYKNSTAINVTTRPHAAGVVDVVVTTPDGQSQRLAGGYRYAAPAFVDFNGEWKGYVGDEGEAGFRFTIENDVLVSVSCRSDYAFSRAASTRTGEFVATGDAGAAMTGGLLKANYAEGTINIGACAPYDTIWFATRQ